MKRYTVGTKTITQGELSLNDGKKMIALLKDINWEGALTGGQSLYEIAMDYLEANVLEQMFTIILKGDLPKSEFGDWMTANLAVEVITDFFNLNASLMKRVESLLTSLTPSKAESVKNK